MNETMLAEASVRWIDLAAFVVMGLLWLGVFAMLVAIYKILRGKARGDARWSEPGM
ncbi:MAG: hypothetical protein JNL82_09165 [Myxococcales bacterium]|nr:hypothetical protein [Myxococcales bacterium]